MGLIGDSHNEMQHNKPTSLSNKEIAVCCSPTSTLTKGQEYQVKGHFSYLNKQYFENDHWWEWNEFITIKNNEGWTVKVNLSRFTLKSKLEAIQKQKDQYEMDPINILREAHQLIPQKYE